MKLVLGPRYMDNKHLNEKLREYREGLLDDYNCFLYIPPIPYAPEETEKTNGLK